MNAKQETYNEILLKLTEMNAGGELSQREFSYLRNEARNFYGCTDFPFDRNVKITFEANGSAETIARLQGILKQLDSSYIEAPLPPEEESPTESKSPVTIWHVIGFFFPLLAVIFYCLWVGGSRATKRENIQGRSMGRGAVLGFIVQAIILIIVCVTSKHFAERFYEYANYFL